MNNKKVLYVTLLSTSILLGLGSLGFSIYMYNNPKVIYVKGEDGEDGKDGANGKDGTNGINGKDGSKGDTGATGPKGDKGDTGDRGPQGEKGKDGSSFLTGEGVPSSTLGNNGDTYLDTSSENLDLYKKVDGSWTIVAQLKDTSTSTINEESEGEDTGDREVVDEVIEEEDEENASSYSINISYSSVITGCSVVANTNSAKANDLITLTIIESGDYTISTINVTHDDPVSSSPYTLDVENYSLNSANNKEITFTMPASNITLEATFAIQMS